jgi:hypothetical protein
MEQFYVICPPTNPLLVWLLGDLTPKERWKLKHRSERMARSGRRDPTPEIGAVKGFKFIEHQGAAS